MELTVEQVDGPVPVTVLALRGKLDASNFEQVIARGRELYAAGTRSLLVDLSELSFMGSSGLVALHVVTLVLRGEPPPDSDSGWGAFRAMGGSLAGGAQERVKLLSPQPKIAQMLAVTGMDEFYPIFTDRAAALASFA